MWLSKPADIITDHGLLSGLSDNDHLQYILRNILTAHGDVLTRNGANIVRLAPNADGKVLTTHGIGSLPTWETPAAADFDMFGKYICFFPWLSKDGLYEATYYGGGTVDMRGQILFIQTSSTLNDSMFVSTRDPIRNIYEANKKITAEWVITKLDSVTNVTRVLYMSAVQTLPWSDTSHHFGFKIMNARIYASNGNGTTQTITDTGIDTTIDEQLARLKVIFNPTNDIKFYHNNTLVATHTTNLPTVDDYFWVTVVKTLEAVSKYIRIGRSLLQVEY